MIAVIAIMAIMVSIHGTRCPCRRRAALGRIGLFSKSPISLSLHLP